MDHQSESLESKYKNIFQIMLQGDMKIEKLKKQVIAIVGKTRSGKSTLANWICAVSMIGQEDLGEYFYKSIANDLNQIGHGVVSQTLIPNIQEIDENTSAVDMAGYGDTRNYIGVLGVSHMLKLVFQQAKNLKFLLVIDETDINASQGQAKCQPVKHFIDMFKMDIMSSQAKKRILQSVSIVINKAQRDYAKTYQYLKGVLINIKKPNFRYEKKDLIIELLQHCWDNNKIHLFEKAKNGIPSPECTILIDFEKTKKWNYVNFKELQKSEKKQIITLPFASLYEQLQEGQQKIFKDQVTQRIQFYKTCLSLFQTALRTPQEKTKEGAEKEERANWYRKSINYQKVFKLLVDILQKYNFYQQDQYEIPEQYKQRYTQMNYEEKNDPPTGIQLIEMLEEIYKSTVQLKEKGFDQTYAKFLTRMQMIMKETLKKIKKMLCKNKENQKQFNELAFIYLRGFQQFRMLVEIDPKLISATPQAISDTIKSYFTDGSLESIKADFFLGLRNQYIRSLPPSVLQKLIIEGQQISISKGKTSKGFNKKDIKTKQMSIQQSFAYISLKQENFKKALNSFISLGMKIQKFIKQYEQEDQGEGIFMMRITNIGKIAECLQKLNHYRKALRLFITINYAPSAIRCYEQIIKQPTDQRLQAHVDFANYCMNSGNANKALQLLQISYQLCQSQADFDKVKKGFVQLALLVKVPLNLAKKIEEHINVSISDLSNVIQEIRQFAQDEKLLE